MGKRLQGPDTTERRFLQSTIAAYGSLSIRLVASFSARLVLARLILPEGHGLYELALRMVILASAVRDLGLVHHLIRDERKPYGTVLLFSISTGLVITMGLEILAGTFSFLDPGLPAVLRVLAPWIVLDSLIAVPKAFFERELRIREIAAPEILRSVLMALVSVGLAWLGYGVWSFVIGDLVASAVLAVIIWIRAWDEIDLHADLDLIPDLLRRSRLLFLIWVTSQLVTYIDVYIVKIFGTTTEVGYYSRAYMIAFLGPEIFAPRSLMPALVAYRDDPERFQGTFRLATLFLLTWETLVAYFLFFNADTVVRILLGPQWDAAVPLVRILCFVPLLAIFGVTGGQVLKARNEDRVWLAAMLLNLASLVAFGILFSSRWGASGMAWANFLLCGHWIILWRMSRIFSREFGRLLLDVGFTVTVPLPFFMAVSYLLPNQTWLRFTTSSLAVGLSAAIIGARFYPSFRQFFRGDTSAGNESGDS